MGGGGTSLRINAHKLNSYRTKLKFCLSHQNGNLIKLAKHCLVIYKLFINLTLLLMHTPDGKRNYSAKYPILLLHSKAFVFFLILNMKPLQLISSSYTSSIRLVALQRLKLSLGEALKKLKTELWKICPNSLCITKLKI